MSKFNIIPAGYRFTFVSWENDGDNYKTIIKEGVEEKQAKLLVELAKADSGLENAYEPDETELKTGYNVLWPIFEKHKDVFSSKQMESFKADVGAMTEYINEKILGYSSEGYWMRVLDSYKIEYIPEEIKIEDVTDKF